MKKDSYPKELFVELINDQYLLARITICKTHKGFMIELDLVLKESRKIYKHIDTLFSGEPEREAVDDAILKLRNFIKKSSDK